MTRFSSPGMRRWFFRFALVGLCLLLLPIVSTLYQPLLPDFIEYWAAGRLNLQGQNPYGAAELLSLQRPLGWLHTAPLMMWNPPWTLPLVMPLGLFDYRLSRLLWYFLQVLMIVYCADLFWRVYGGPKRSRWVAWGIALASSYTIYVLIFGQISPLILLGMAWFVALVEHPSHSGTTPKLIQDPRISDILAGAAAFLISIKPQAFYLFFPLLLIWVIAARRFWILAGLAGAFLLALLTSLAFNPDVIVQYIQAVLNRPPQDWATPTLGYWARRVFGLDLFWLQFPSVLLGFAWGVWYWRENSRSWVWAQALPLLAVVSLVTTAYAWTHDQVILIPTSLHILAYLCARQAAWRPAAIAWAAAWVVFHLGTLPLHFGQSDDRFVWQAPAILLLYALGLKLIPSPDSFPKSAPPR
jgi:hypothetical protein